MTTKTTLKPCLELSSTGIKKLETFFKISAPLVEQSLVQIDPQEETIQLSYIDPRHICQAIHVITNEDEDFTMYDLDKVFQFNVNVKDFSKMLTLNSDKQIRIYPDLDEENNFDMLRIEISENNVALKEIFLPIHTATGLTLVEQGIKLINELIHETHNCIVLNFDIEFFNEILKDVEIFQNERIRFNVSIKDKSILSFNIETFDADTDKMRRIKTNLLKGLHFQTKKVNIPDSSLHHYWLDASLEDLKKLIVSSKIYKSIQLIIAEKKPVCVLYETKPDDLSSVENTLTCFLAPILRNDDIESKNT